MPKETTNSPTFDEWFDQFIDEVTRPANSISGAHTEPDPETNVDYLTRLLSEADGLFAEISEEDTNKILWDLVGASGYLMELYNSTVPLEKRRACIGVLTTFFRVFIASRCEDTLGHLSQPGRPLNSICYMWWDIFPTWGTPDDPRARAIDDLLIGCMEDMLDIESRPCRESAIHGLGHWSISYPEIVAEILGRFLLRKDLDDQIRNYAESARSGCIQ